MLVGMPYALLFSFLSRLRSSRVRLEEASEEQLMTLYQKGNQEAFMMLTEKLQRPLYFYIYGMAGGSTQ